MLRIDNTALKEKLMPIPEEIIMKLKTFMP